MTPKWADIQRFMPPMPPVSEATGAPDPNLVPLAQRKPVNIPGIGEVDWGWTGSEWEPRVLDPESKTMVVLSPGPNGEVTGKTGAYGDSSLGNALAELAPVAAVALGGPMIGGLMSGAGALAPFTGATAAGTAGTAGASLADLELLGAGLPTEVGVGGTGFNLGAGAGVSNAAYDTFMQKAVTDGLVGNASRALSQIEVPLDPFPFDESGNALNTAAKTLADLAKPISEWGTEEWLSALGRAAPGLIGAYASSEQGNALSDLAKSQTDAENARYNDLVARESARYEDLKGREDAAIARQNEYMQLGMSREDARFAELKEREDAAIARQNEFINLGMSREDARFAELKERENEAIARQRGDIEYGRTQTQPYRTRLSDLYANPDSFLTSNEVTKPVQMGSDILARSLSVGGNPIGSGNALQQLQSYSADQLFSRLGEEKTRLGNLGGMSSFGQSGATIPGIGSSLPGSTTTPVPGIGSSLPSGTSTSIPGTGSSLPGSATAGSNVGYSGGSNLSLASLGSDANIWNSLGSAASDVFKPQKSLVETLTELKRAGVF